MEALGINVGFLIVLILNFAILTFGLYAGGYKPILGILDERKAKIAQGLEDARIAGEARANAETHAAKIIADAQADAARRVADASQCAEQAAAGVRASAEEEKARILKTATEDAAQEKTRVLADVRPQVTALA